MEEQMHEVFDAAQLSSSTHPKVLQKLERIFNQADFTEFLESFNYHLLDVFYSSEINKTNPYANRALEFSAKFVARLVERHGALQEEADSSTHPFFKAIIQKVLQYTDVVDTRFRYRSCQFLALTLHAIDSNVSLDEDVCDEIERAMLERIKDQLSVIREQAVIALHRLQSAHAIDCPVIQAYLTLLDDKKASVRAVVLENLAITPFTVNYIARSVRDPQEIVRNAAFSKCILIKPKFLKLKDRQLVLLAGFQEENAKCVDTFKKYVLPRWLTCFDRNYQKFLTAFRIDSCKGEMENTYNLFKHLIEYWIEKEDVNDLIDGLQLNDDKVVPLEDVEYDNIAFWSLMFQHFKSSSDLDHFADMIVPDLSDFVVYIESIIHNVQGEHMDNWQSMTFDQILNFLLDMVQLYDMSEEFGRSNLRTFIRRVLRNVLLSPELMYRLIEIDERLSNDITTFIDDYCEIINDIRESLLEEPPTQLPAHNPDNDFLIAELMVKINIIQGEIDDATENRDFELCVRKQKESEELQQKLDSLKSQPAIVPAPTQTRSPTDSPKIVLHWLTVLASLLQIPNVRSLQPNLLMLKDQAVDALHFDDLEIQRMSFNIIMLSGALDQKIAEVNFKYACEQIVNYRITPQRDNQILMISIRAFNDFLLLYPDIVINEADSILNRTNINKTRRLYNNDIDGTFATNDIEQNDVLEILSDIMHDQDFELQKVVTLILRKLILNKIIRSPTLISKFILKWLIPQEDESGLYMQQTIGIILEEYARSRSSQDELEKAIIPTLQNIAAAGRGNPLAECDIDKVIKFLVALTKIQKPDKIINQTHTLLIKNILAKLTDVSNPKLQTMYVKFLLELQISTGDREFLEFTRDALNAFIPNVQDRFTKRGLQTFLKRILNSLDAIVASVETEPIDNSEIHNSESSKRGWEEEEEEGDDNIPKRRQVENDFTINMRIQTGEISDVDTNEDVNISNNDAQSVNNVVDKLKMKPVVRIVSDIRINPVAVKETQKSSVKTNEKETESSSSSSNNKNKNKKLKQNKKKQAVSSNDENKNEDSHNRTRPPSTVNNVEPSHSRTRSESRKERNKNVETSSTQNEGGSSRIRSSERISTKAQKRKSAEKKVEAPELKSPSPKRRHVENSSKKQRKSNQQAESVAPTRTSSRTRKSVKKYT